MVETEIVHPKVEDNPENSEDSLGKDNFEEMEKKYKLEIEGMEKNIEEAKKFKEMDTKMFELEKQVWALHLEGDNIEALKPDIKLKTQPKYWELQKQMLELEYELKKKDRESRIASHDQGIENMEKNIKSIKDKLKEMGVDNE